MIKVFLRQGYSQEDVFQNPCTQKYVKKAKANLCKK